MRLKKKSPAGPNAGGGGGSGQGKNEKFQFVHQESEFGAGNLTSYVRSPTDIPGIPNLAERAVFAKVETDP